MLKKLLKKFLKIKNDTLQCNRFRLSRRMRAGEEHPLRGKQSLFVAEICVPKFVTIKVSLLCLPTRVTNTQFRQEKFEFFNKFFEKSD